MEVYTEGEEFIDTGVLPRGSYENCVFRKCQWLEADLSRYTFIDCEFKECDLTMVKMNSTVLNGVVFTNSKLTGIRFDYADNNLFDTLFSECIMHLTSFYQRILKDMTFNKCDLKEADFTESNLSDSIFDNCNLQGAIFKQSILRNTDFSTAENVFLELTENDVREAHFTMQQIPNLVASFDLNIVT